MSKFLNESEILEVVKSEFNVSIIPYEINLIIDDADLTPDQKEWARDNIELTVKLK